MTNLHRIILAGLAALSLAACSGPTQSVTSASREAPLAPDTYPALAERDITRALAQVECGRTTRAGSIAMHGGMRAYPVKMCGAREGVLVFWARVDDSRTQLFTDVTRPNGAKMVLAQGYFDVASGANVFGVSTGDGAICTVIKPPKGLSPVAFTTCR